MSARVRVAVHALDRTGPPMLALAFVRWIRGHRPDLEPHVVAFRGGEMLGEFIMEAPTVVLLDPSEPWDHAEPDPARVAAIAARAVAPGPADVTLLVSVSAGQVLPYVLAGGLVAAWVVERGDDLHWLDAPFGLRDRVSCWLTGSDGTRRELEQALGDDVVVEVVPEFIAPKAPAPAPEVIERCRIAVGAGVDDVLVVGAGIATTRKAPDLFVEVAHAHRRIAGRPARFVWFGGERDPLFGPIVDDLRRSGNADVRFVGTVPDLDPWLAAADVFLHPARLDAFPLVCLHAALAGTPVVGFRSVSALEEMFGEDTPSAPYPDVAELARLVDRLAGPDGAAVARCQQSAVESRFVSSVGGPRLATCLDLMLDADTAP